MGILTNNLLKCLITIFFVTTNSVCKESPRIIIVGAGVSGIATAAKLLENNFTDLTILEAKQRIGGRIHTVPFGDNVVDLGAEWCNGEKGNVVVEMALGSERVDWIFYYSTGKLIDKAFTAELNRIFFLMYRKPSGNGKIHIRGAYSYQTIKSRLNETFPEIVPSEPLGGARVLFAGEATNPIHYSTVHGTLESGQREAKRIIDLY